MHECYWSSENVRVESHYLKSLFIGHGTTDDILKHFGKAMKDLDQVKTWNIGMDGPNVNLAFERELTKSCEELPSLLCLGRCGLHTVHRSFQSEVKETNWRLSQYLLQEYKLFKDSPAKHEDCVKYTVDALFPSKFCNHR